LVLSGTGADGAYHAGVLRALDEAGVKLDLVAGRGIGAVAAVLTAIGGSERLWDAQGLWRGGRPARWYRWRWPLRLLWLLAVTALTAMALPLVLVAAAVVVYAAGLLLGMAGLEAGRALVSAYVRLVATLFDPAAIPTWLPRLVTLGTLGAAVALISNSLLSWWRAPVRRRLSGNRTWVLLGPLLDASRVVKDVTGALWDLLRGGASLGVPQPYDLSRRYADLLCDNLGQPEFRELLITVHDLDARRDLVFGVVGERYRRTLFPPPGAQDGRGPEAFDLAGLARDHLLDVLSASVDIGGMTAPPLMRFPPETNWRGEAHRLTDRPASLTRLLEEAAKAGAEQAILVSAAARAPAAHELIAPRADARGRLSELVASTETAALRDAAEHLGHRFRGLYVIRPSHNPVLPLDVKGAYDQRSDRRHSLTEMMERGYEDAYRQFIEPVVGAAGDRLAQTRADEGAE
jgi:hypothetical protein